MAHKRIVLALGGNALGNNPTEQLELVKKTAQPIIDLIKEDYQVVIVHGNGPQVGDIHTKSNYPFPESNAMSQGYIGYHLQQALLNACQHNGLRKNIVTLTTQVLVDAADKAFQKPTKPIGAFHKEPSALIAQKFAYIEDANRGYRRVVASPKPLAIVELAAIESMLTNPNNIVICCGGGGIPVVQAADHTYSGIAAVIDKDKTAALLAEKLQADMLVILTAVKHVAINFGKPNQQNLTSLDVATAQKYMQEQQFGTGSMLPKIEAALTFVQNTKKAAVIGLLDDLKAIMAKQTGTIIHA